MKNLQVTFNDQISNEVFRVNLMGRLNSMNAYDFKNDLLDVIRSGPKNCIVDLRSLTSVDVIGLNALLLAHKKLEKQGGQLTIITDAASPIDTVLNLTKFNKVLNVQHEEVLV